MSRKIKIEKPFPGANGEELKVGAIVEVPSKPIPTDGAADTAIQAGYASEVKEEALKESPAPAAPHASSEPAGAAPEIKDISEVVPKAVDVEGPQRNVEELVGRVVVIEQFGLRPSQYEGREDYATVQIISDNGEKAWFNTGSGPILDALKQVKDKLPVRCRIAQKKSEKGRRYFALESAKETK